jgi:hypothetical protein
MRSRYQFVHILAALSALLLGSMALGATIDVLETFDFPGTGNNTLPQKISDQGVIVGVVIDVNAVASGFYRSRNGRFSEAFVEPNDTGNLTQGRGINNSRRMCGEYLNGGDGTFHGYFFQHQHFVEFDIADALDTIPLGLNNANDFAGSVILSDGTQEAFVSIGGDITTFAISGALASLAYSLNTSNQSVGYYLDADGVTTHGYLRDSDGTLTFPIDPAGSVGTVLFGNNDSNWVVGRYADAAGLTHGLFFVTADDILTFDYPNSTFTSLNGINQQGYICGRYLDTAGIFHGFLAKVDPNTANLLNRKAMPMTPVQPRVQSPAALARAAY